MKKEINPLVLIVVAVVALVAVIFIGYRTLFPPQAVVSMEEAMKELKARPTPAANQGAPPGLSGAGGGP